MGKKSRAKKNRNRVYYELTDDIGSIPKGCYEFDSEDADSFLFTLGPKILFFIPKECSSFMRRIESSQEKPRVTNIETFLDGYYALLKNPKPLPMVKNFFGTCCSIDASLARELQ